MTPKQARIQIGYFIDCLKRIDHRSARLGQRLIEENLSLVIDNEDSFGCYDLVERSASDYRYTIERIY